MGCRISLELGISIPINIIDVLKRRFQLLKPQPNIQREAHRKKTMSNVPNLLTTVGCLFLLHAAFSCFHFRGLLEEFGVDLQQGGAAVPPLDVVVEAVVGWCMCLVGQLTAIGPLRSTSMSGGKRTQLVAPSYITRDFDCYDHRDKAIRTKYVATVLTKT